MSKDDLVKFLEWLKLRGIFLATHHTHSDRCKTGTRRTLCGYVHGELEPTKQDLESLAIKYLEKE